MIICGNDKCKKETKNKKFCSSSCSATVQNIGKRRHGRALKDIECLSCGETFKAPRRRKFCSRACYVGSGVLLRTDMVERWLSGEWSGTTTIGLSRTIRAYLLKEADYRCQSPTCYVPGGWGEKNPVTGYAPLEIEHIDGNYMNNAQDNLIVMCPNCHALTPTYKGLNKGKGRAWRGKYQNFSRVGGMSSDVVDSTE